MSGSSKSSARAAVSSARAIDQSPVRIPNSPRFWTMPGTQPRAPSRRARARPSREASSPARGSLHRQAEGAVVVGPEHRHAQPGCLGELSPRGDRAEALDRPTESGERRPLRHERVGDDRPAGRRARPPRGRGPRSRSPGGCRRRRSRLGRADPRGRCGRLGSPRSANSSTAGSRTREGIGDAAGVEDAADRGRRSRSRSPGDHRARDTPRSPAAGVPRPPPVARPPTRLRRLARGGQPSRPCPWSRPAPARGRSAPGRRIRGRWHDAPPP